jgi:hypothetical protein
MGLQSRLPDSTSFLQVVIQINREGRSCDVSKKAVLQKNALVCMGLQSRLPDSTSFLQAGIQKHKEGRSYDVSKKAVLQAALTGVHGAPVKAARQHLLPASRDIKSQRSTADSSAVLLPKTSVERRQYYIHACCVRKYTMRMYYCEAPMRIRCITAV